MNENEPPREKIFPPQFEAFKLVFDQELEVEKKLIIAIGFMETTLSETGRAPHFLSFWEARRLALPLFKESVSSVSRVELWKKCSELCIEAKRLKDLFEEMSSFAAEQIEIAVQALENEMNCSEEEFISESEFSLEQYPNAMKGSFEKYQNFQRKLNKLNIHAVRINTLRKELLKNELRLRQKNAFLKRLSSVGDIIFPKRRELILMLSGLFKSDVEKFIELHFQNRSREMFYVLREEIKLFQNLAKELTLNTEVFTDTRKRLSECWDICKAIEKERKKERLQQITSSKENANLFCQEIEELKSKFENQLLDLRDVQKEIESLGMRLRKAELEKDHFKMVREKWTQLRNDVQNKLQQEDHAKRQVQEELNKQKRAKYDAFEEKINALMEQIHDFDRAQLEGIREELFKELHCASFSKQEKSALEKRLKFFQNEIEEKKTQEWLNLPEDNRLALEQLETALNHMKAKRAEIKSNIDTLRKVAGSSHLDFEKAMACQQEIEEEKSKLDRLIKSMSEVEKKINDFKSSRTC